MRGFREVLASTVLIGLSLACDGDSNGPGTSDFQWSGQVAQGDQIEIKGIIGSIEASAASGTQVVVTATKVGVRSDPSTVQLEVVSHQDGVTICALYPDVPGQPANECLPGLQGNMNNGDNDVDVSFTVSVPAGIEFVGRTVAGDVIGTSLTSNAFVSTVAGDLSVATTGLATAATVTGSVTASIGLASWDRDLTFTTVTGDVTVEVPANTNADVVATTTTGTVTSDFPLVEVTAGNWQGTLGSGGRQLTLSAVDGNVVLRSGS